MNVLIIADYRTPKSGNFVASILDLGITLRKQGGNTVYMFPESKSRGGGIVGVGGLRVINSV